jgi:hypothetical protein
VNILSDKKAEIVMVLDYSGSMRDPVADKVKYEVMRDAATKLVTDLSKTNPEDIKFGIVPFSNHVYTTMPGAYVKGASGTWTGCTQDRPYPNNIKDDTPTNDVATQWGQRIYSGPKTEDDKDQEKYTCDGLIANNMKIIDLTNDFKKITSQLELMKPYGYTHIALGTEFGYHMLSPNAPFTQGAKYDDKTTKKFMVVLTDGKQTARGFGEGNIRTVEQGDTNLASLCKSAKAKGITMMTVAFDLDDPDTVDRLQTCASEPSTGFFVAKNDEALQSAFESIKAAVASDIYLSN